MNCTRAIDYVHSLERFGVKPGLERVSLLCEKLGNPQDSLKFIHVAGTNGKGSVSTVCSKILTESGFKTGLYTSPYVVDFRERIQLDGRMIEPADLARCVETVKETSEKYGIEVTEFEFITAAAFIYFKEMKCDYVVLEVGLGGRFDATNIIKAPLVAVITSISLDHTSVLGDTVEKIAFEKAGIIKPGSKVITYPIQNPAALAVIENACKNAGDELIIPRVDSLRIESSSPFGSEFVFDNSRYFLPLAGEHMVYNAITAITAVKSFLSEIDSTVIFKALKKCSMPARLEPFDMHPAVILDGGHNAQGAEALKKYIRSSFGDKKITAVCSIMADKDYEKYLAEVLPCVDRFIAAQAKVPRALDSHTLAQNASEICSDVTEIPDAVRAVEFAIDTAGKDDAVIVCGSFYFAGEVREYITDRCKMEEKND